MRNLEINRPQKGALQHTHALRCRHVFANISKSDGVCTRGALRIKFFTALFVTSCAPLRNAPGPAANPTPY